MRNGTTWTEESKLTAPEPSAAIDFGHSVAVDNDFLLVGAGAAYIFGPAPTPAPTSGAITVNIGTYLCIQAVVIQE